MHDKLLHKNDNISIPPPPPTQNDFETVLVRTPNFIKKIFFNFFLLRQLKTNKKNKKRLKFI